MVQGIVGRRLLIQVGEETLSLSGDLVLIYLPALIVFYVLLTSVTAQHIDAPM